METRDWAFKSKTIVGIVTSKINAWTNTITDEILRKRIKESYILTGGAIASLLQGQMPNDYDIYFDDVKVCRDVAHYYVNQHLDGRNGRNFKVNIETLSDQVKIMIKSAGVLGDDVDNTEYDYFEQMPESLASDEINKFLGNPQKAETPESTGKYKAQYITSNAISLSDGVQVITRFVGDPEEIHKNFDYVHATNYYSKKTGLVLKQEALEAIMTRELVYVGSLYPIASLFRMRKFIQRGWTINVGEILKMSWDISKLDLNNTKVLEEQLTGVDVAYFTQLLSLLNSSDRTLDRAYLVELIDRIF